MVVFPPVPANDLPLFKSPLSFLEKFEFLDFSCRLVVFLVRISCRSVTAFSCFLALLSSLSSERREADGYFFSDGLDLVSGYRPSPVLQGMS